MTDNTVNNFRIGVDVGGTKIEAALVDATGAVLNSARSLRVMVTLRCRGHCIGRAAGRGNPL